MDKEIVKDILREISVDIDMLWNYIEEDKDIKEMVDDIIEKLNDLKRVL